MSTEPSDAELAVRIGRGDRWAQEAFYRRYVAEVVGLAQRLMGRTSDAEDVAQEAFVTAFQSWSQLRELDRAAAWLMRIAVRSVHRRFRRQRLLRLLGLDRSLDEAPLEALARDDTSAEHRSELAALDEVLKRLSPELRIAWMLRNVEGLQLDEVAEQCDCSKATAKRRIAAAHGRVLRHVAIEEVDDG